MIDHENVMLSDAELASEARAFLLIDSLPSHLRDAWVIGKRYAWRRGAIDELRIEVSDSPVFVHDSIDYFALLYVNGVAYPYPTEEMAIEDIEKIMSDREPVRLRGYTP